MNPRLIIVLLLVIVVIGVVVALATLQSTPAPAPTDVGTGQVINNQPLVESVALPTITPEPKAQIVVAVQDIPRGTRIDNTVVAIYDWPASLVPQNATSNIEDVIGLIARTDIYREQPILGNLVVPDFQSLANIGSDAALVTPPNRVLVAVPMNRLTSVAYAIRPGDRVDLMASLLFVDVDQVFQSAEPNSFNLINVVQSSADPATGTAAVTTVSYGDVSISGAFDTRLIPSAGSVPVLVAPSEAPRPRLSVQRTVQDALVVWVGNFPADGKLFQPAATPTPEVSPTPAENGSGTPLAPTPVTVTADIVSLAVSPQDAVVLTWFVEAKVPFTFALRSAATTTLPQTDPVTLDYIMGRFNILVPEKFNYAIEPAIRSIRSLEVGDQITLKAE